MATVGSHQQGAFSTPINGQTADASVVLANDNANRTTTNAHDADATIHIQSSVLASRPAAGTAGRVWITSDGLRAYVDSGSVWNELDYLSKTGGGTVAGAVTLGASLTVTGTTNLNSDIAVSTNKVTIAAASGNTGIAGTLSVTGLVTANSGLAVAGNSTITGTLSGITTLTATSLAGTLTTAAQPNITSVGVLASPHMTSPVVDSGGLTVTAGGINVIAGGATITGHLLATAHGMFGAWDGSGDGFSLHVSKDTAGTATGGAQTLPANPAGFLTWLLGATTIKVPYYNA